MTISDVIATPSQPTTATISFMLENPHFDLLIPDSFDPSKALGRTTHLAIGAHQDDLEIMAYHGIVNCYNNDSKWFTGVTVTDGASSSRIGPYASFNNEEMVAQRLKEQQDAARLGQYAAQFQLGYASASIRDPQNSKPAKDLQKILLATTPEVLYLHNPADKHDTHIAALQKCLTALKAISNELLPKQIYGCEVWRDLDWLPDDKKIALESGKEPELAAKLLAVFDSQISGGKRYDLATLGRRRAHATFSEPRESDSSLGITLALDLMPLVQADAPTLEEFTKQLIEEFQHETQNRIRSFTP